MCAAPAEFKKENLSEGRQVTPVPRTPRRKKPFTKGASPDLTELIARLKEVDETRPPFHCPLENCPEQLIEIQKDLASLKNNPEQLLEIQKDVAAIKSCLHTFLGNGQPGLFQKLEGTVKTLDARTAKNEKLLWSFCGGLFVINLVLQIVLKHFMR